MKEKNEADIIYTYILIAYKYFDTMSYDNSDMHIKLWSIIKSKGGLYAQMAIYVKIWNFQFLRCASQTNSRTVFSSPLRV